MGVSFNPQKIRKGVWYYESLGHIEVFVRPEEAFNPGDEYGLDTIRFRISKEKLKTSLRRMAGRKRTK
jgi:hypothetical protein